MLSNIWNALNKDLPEVHIEENTHITVPMPIFQRLKGIESLESVTEEEYSREDDRAECNAWTNKLKFE